MRSRACEVLGLAGERRDVGERNVEVRRAHGVADGFGLIDDARLVLRVGAVDRVFAGARVVVLASLVEKELREIAVARVARLAIQADEADLEALVAGDVRLLAWPVRRVHRVGRFERGVERRAFARRLEVSHGGFEERPVGPDRGLRIGIARVDSGREARDHAVGVGLELGILAILEHVGRRLDELRRGVAAVLLRPREHVLDRDRPVDLDLARPEPVVDLDRRGRHGTDRVVRSRLAPRRS